MTLLPVPRLRGLLQKRSGELFWAILRRSLLAMAAGASLLQRPPRIFDLCFFDSRGRMMRMNIVLPQRVRVATARTMLIMVGPFSPMTAVILILVVMGMRPWLLPFFLRHGTQTRCPSSLEWPKALLMGGWLVAQSGLPGSRMTAAILTSRCRSLACCVAVVYQGIGPKNRKEINKTRKGQRTVLITGLSPKRGSKKDPRGKDLTR